MKRALITAAVLAMGTSLAVTSFAQGRHDEKPHGSTKPSAASIEGKSSAMTGGRHDEKPHGSQKKAAKKGDATKAAGSDNSGK